MTNLIVSVDGFGVPLKVFVFSGGEVQVRLEERREYGAEAQIIARILSANDLMATILVTDALRRDYPGIRISLVCRYLPYARQDRVCAQGEALSLAVLCRLLNAQQYESIEVWDAHSDVALALLDRVEHVTAAMILRRHLPLIAGLPVIAPDAGAAKRAMAVAKAIGGSFTQAEKVRDPNTGAITGTHVPPLHSVSGGDFLIVDDICDGGRTFIELAKAIRAAATRSIRLYVTHGIFSAGFEPLRPHFAHVYVANPLFDTATKPDFITIL